MSYENLQGDIGSSSGQYVKMGTSGTASTLALTTSNVGIGTTTPSKKLDVKGDAIIQGDNWGTGNAAVLFLGDSNHYIKSVNGNGVRIGTYLAADGIALQEHTGNVGIGTTGPASKLQVNSGDIELGDLGKGIIFNVDSTAPSTLSDGNGRKRVRAVRSTSTPSNSIRFGTSNFYLIIENA